MLYYGLGHMAMANVGRVETAAIYSNTHLLFLALGQLDLGVGLIALIKHKLAAYGLNGLSLASLCESLAGFAGGEQAVLKHFALHKLSGLKSVPYLSDNIFGDTALADDNDSILVHSKRAEICALFTCQHNIPSISL